MGCEEPAKHDLSSLRLLGSVGEPINPEAWMWYHEHIGGGRCPIVDTWWQTETGGIMISPLPGATTTKPGSATFPLPGVSAEVVDDQGQRVERGRRLPHAHPAVAGDAARHLGRSRSATTTPTGARFHGRYFAGDGAKLDDDGYLWLLGRVDDVMNVSGHRISTTEVESALVSHPAVAEAAVVGANDATTGQAIIAYVILRGGDDVDGRGAARPRRHEIGAIAKPKTIYLTPDLPKTAVGQDHAPPAARRRRGPQPRRHHARSPTPASSTSCNAERPSRATGGLTRPSPADALAAMPARWCWSTVQVGPGGGR